MEKLPVTGAVTINEMVAVWVTLPPVPLMVMVYVPAVTVEATAKVTEEVPEPGAAMGFVPKVTVTPEGCPLAESVMAESKPSMADVVTVELPLLP
jgi:hypothetical protein